MAFLKGRKPRKQALKQELDDTIFAADPGNLIAPSEFPATGTCP